MENFSQAGIFSALALIISITTLYIQTQFTSKQLKLNNFIEFTKRYLDIMSRMPEKIHNIDSLESPVDEQEKNQIMIGMRAYFDLCWEEYFLFANAKLISKSFWEMWQQAMEGNLQKPAFKKAWQEIRTDPKLSKNFINFVDHTIVKGQIT